METKSAHTDLNDTESPEALILENLKNKAIVNKKLNLILISILIKIRNSKNITKTKPYQISS